MANGDDFNDHYSASHRQDGPPGADGVVDNSGDPQDDWQRAPDVDAGHADSQPLEPDASQQTSQPSKPDIDAFVDNTKALLRRSTDVLPYVWIAIVIVGLIPVMWKLAHGYDPLDPFGFQFGFSIFVVEILCQITALTLLAASFPVGRACLMGDDEACTLDGGTDILFEHLLDAIPLSIIYYAAFVGGLMMCIAPGLFAAVFLLPALYLGTAGGESLFRAILKAPGQINEYSTFFTILLVGLMALGFLLSFGIGFTITSVVPDGDMGAVITDPLFVVGFSIGFIAVTAVLYLFYIALMALFVTAEVGNITS